MRTTWMPHEKHGRLTQQSDLPNSVFAFPKQRKEPLTDERHVRNAVARFDQVIDVSDADRALAFANIEKAAKYYNVDLSETSWYELGVHPQLHRKEAAAKGVETIERGCRKGSRDEARERDTERGSRESRRDAQTQETRPLSLRVLCRIQPRIALSGNQTVQRRAGHERNPADRAGAPPRGQSCDSAISNGSDSQTRVS